MLRIAILFSALCLLNAVDLEGTWVSNWPLTEEHLMKNAKIDLDTIDALANIMGKMVIHYKEGICTVTMPQTVVNGEVIEQSSETYNYHVLFSSASQIALTSENDTDDKVVCLLQFSDKDTYWIYLGHIKSVDLHIREYFTRMQ